MLVVGSGLGVVVMAVRRRLEEVREIACVVGPMLVVRLRSMMLRRVVVGTVHVVIEHHVEPDAHGADARRHPQSHDQGREQAMSRPSHTMTIP